MIRGWLNEHGHPTNMERRVHVLVDLAKDDPYAWEPKGLTLRDKAIQQIEASIGQRLNRADLIAASKRLLRELLDEATANQSREMAFYGDAYEYAARGDVVQGSLGLGVAA